MQSIGVRLSGTNLERAADHNQRITLQAIRVNKSVTRVGLAQITGLTAPAIANIIKRLLDEGLVMETGRLRNGRGQPGKVIEINSAARFAFGINIDRDHISFVLSNFVGQIVAERHWDKSFMLPRDVQQLWRTNAPQMLVEAEADVERLCGIGIAIPDELGTIPIPGTPRNYVEWSKVDLDLLFAQPFDVPILVENDAKAAALGEQQFGLGPQYASIFYLLISIGLGGALLIDGKVVRGHRRRSGEIGLIRVGGSQGKLLQDHVALSRLSLHLAKRGHVLSSVFGNQPDERCADAVNEWIDEASSILAPALMAVNCLIDPAVILVGSRLPERIVEQLCAETSAKLKSEYPSLPAYPPIQRAHLSGAASVIGASTLPFIEFHLPIEDALWKEAAE